MMELYMQAGITETDAKNILSTMAKYKDFFVRHMMVKYFKTYKSCC
jgi:hypothetical protein